MSLYVINPNSLKVEQAYEQTPVISLCTNCSSEDGVPSVLRDFSDRTDKGDLSIFQENKPAKDADATLCWLSGDRLLEGSMAGLRREISEPGNRSLFPVHLPCFAEVDLIGLQPRLWENNKGSDTTSTALRIAGSLPPPELECLLEESDQLWARLYSALLGEQKRPGNGIDRLSRLWQDSPLIPKPYGSLLLRNLIVLLIKHNQYEQAENLLKLGMDYYPHYAELAYLSALLCASKERYSEIPAYISHATQNADHSYVGSGGEDSYRSLALLGSVFELVGNQLMAVKCYLQGAQIYPAYAPSVFGILRQRLPYDGVQELRYRALGALARREPQYLEMIFDYFLLHRQVSAARSVLESSKISERIREKLQRSLDDATAAYRPSVRRSGTKPGVLLVGPFNVHSSLARINRETAAALAAEKDLEVVFEPHGVGEVPGTTLPHFDSIAEGLNRRVHRLDLTIRHHWPPNFRPPACGKLIAIVPWEYGSVPLRWIPHIKSGVDEMWVPSKFSREAFVRSGVLPEKIRVIPNGIDTEVFGPAGNVWHPEGCRDFVFLFVGGSIPRKGVDVLWEAYSRAFSSNDDVTLLIKDTGSSTFYKEMTLINRLSSAACKGRSPHLLVFTEQLDNATLASLYRGSNVVVLPYRGEGFGMPLAEGLACGRPVITTGLGPAREFCPPEASYFVSAQECEIPKARPELGPMSGPVTWFEPNIEELSIAMRWAFEHREEAARRGALGAEKVRGALNWKRITGMQIKRIRHLLRD